MGAIASIFRNILYPASHRHRLGNTSLPLLLRSSQGNQVIAILRMRTGRRASVLGKKTLSPWYLMPPHMGEYVLS
jgi:hypothetical protein